MAGHPSSDPGPHPGHREKDLRAVSGDPSICLPYSDFSRDQAPADPGYPFIDDFFGGNGVVSRGGLPDHARDGQAVHAIVGDGVGDDRVGSVSAAGRPS